MGEKMNVRRQQMADVADLIVFLLSIDDDEIFKLLSMVANHAAEAGVPASEIQAICRTFPGLDKREGRA